MAKVSALAMRTLPRLSAKASTEAVVDCLQHAGAVVVEGAAERARLAQVKQDLGPWFDEARPGEGYFLGRSTKRFSAVFAKAASTAALAIDPLVLEVIEAVLSGGAERRCDAIQLNLTQAIAIEPGEPAQPIHRDDSMFPFAHDFELMVNAMWALDDFTAENGATQIVPGSHRWARDQRPGPDEITQACAPAGSLILWLGSTLHGGGENRSRASRRGLALSYSLGWLSQAEKLLLSIPPEVAGRLPVRLQRLLGYQVHRPNLGWVEERDPIEWLHGQVGALAPAQDHLTPELEQHLAAFVQTRRATEDA